MHRKYKGKVVFLGVLTQDTRPDAERFLRRYRVTFPNGLDDGSIAEKYKLVGHPTAIFISPSGRILDARVGALTEKQFAEKIEKLFF